MKIYVDADACPVKNIVISEATGADIPVILVTSFPHFSSEVYPEGVETIYVDTGADAADYRIMKLAHKGDLIITQDYGLASLGLAKGCTGLFFISQMSRLQKENIKVFLIRGNHDAANLITKELKLPENVIEFSVDKPETFTIEELQVALHGQGFASRAVTENIAKAYPSKMEGYVNIGLLHTSATGREGHESYAPCSLDDLKEKGYNY